MAFDLRGLHSALDESHPLVNDSFDTRHMRNALEHLNNADDLTPLQRPAPPAPNTQIRVGDLGRALDNLTPSPPRLSPAPLAPNTQIRVGDLGRALDNLTPSPPPSPFNRTRRLRKLREQAKAKAKAKAKARAKEKTRVKVKAKARFHKARNTFRKREIRAPLYLGARPFHIQPFQNPLPAPLPLLPLPQPQPQPQPQAQPQSQSQSLSQSLSQPLPAPFFVEQRARRKGERTRKQIRALQQNTKNYLRSATLNAYGRGKRLRK